MHSSHLCMLKTCMRWFLRRPVVKALSFYFSAEDRRADSIPVLSLVVIWFSYDFKISCNCPVWCCFFDKDLLGDSYAKHTNLPAYSINKQTSMYKIDASRKLNWWDTFSLTKINPWKKNQAYGNFWEKKKFMYR